MDLTALAELDSAARDAELPVARARIESVTALVAGEITAIERELDRVVAAAPGPCDQAAAHLIGAGGKRVRPVAAILSSLAVGNASFDRAAARAVATAAELVHSATLLHDDVMDDADTRRGRPAARVAYGNLVSVLAGDYLLAAALGAVIRTGVPSVVTDLASTLEQLVEGEVLQLRGRRELAIDRAHYLRVARAKTASLFAWCCRSGARAAGGDESAARALGEFGARMGIAFQLLDDVLDVDGRPEATGKPIWTDLREGKATWPVILAVEDGAASRDLVREARDGEPGAAEALATAIRACGAAARTRDRARDESAAAERALDALPDTPARRALTAVARSLVGRGR